MMHMAYWFGTNVGDLLFHGLTVSTLLGFISTCIGVTSLAILFEALKICLVSTRQKAAALASKGQDDGCPNEASQLINNCASPELQQSSFMKAVLIFNQMFLFVTHEIISYIIMLIVMTYNGYYSIAVALGAGIGFFIFSPILVEISRRKGGTMHTRSSCEACSCKDTLKEGEEREEDCRNVDELADGETRTGGDKVERPTTGSDEGQQRAPHHSVEVAMVHSPNEEVC